MASAEAKVVVIALLILAVGFFYTNVRDGTTGYAPVKQTVDMEEYGLAADDFYQELTNEQPATPSEERTKEEFSLEKMFPDALRVDPCSNDAPSQIQALAQGAC